MFNKSSRAQTELLSQALIRFSRLILFVGTLLICAAAFAGEPARTARRDDVSPYESDQRQSRPARIADPSDEDRGFPGDPSDDGRSQSRHRSHSRGPAVDPELPRRQAPRYRPNREHRHDPDSLPEPELIERRLTSRYGSPAVVRLLQSMSPEQSVQLYLEVSALIDARHLKPSSYDARVKQAAKNLGQAVENRAFLQANRLPDDPARLDTFRRDIAQLAACRPISGADEAYQALQWTMRTAERDLGLRASTVALEFVHGATDSLDKYSGFVPAIGRNAPSVDLEDHVVGIGVEIKAEDRGLLIVHALSGGPAAEAGLTSGDVIEAVDGQTVSGTTLECAVDLISGPTGSRVTLTVDRDHRRSDVTLVRRRVEVHSISEQTMLEENVGYIKLEKFAQNSSEEFDQALWSLYRQGMASLIVDVRGNPGGLLTTAIGLSNKFVPSGTIVATRGRDGADNTVEHAHCEQTWKIPLVVLVDENSASASEIFAAAVQENGRGIIVGRRTYGKGTVQTHFPLQTVSGNLRLTTAQFFSPKGRLMAGEGVDPDVHVEAGRLGHRASYERESSYGRELLHDQRGSYLHDGLRHHEAAYRHGGSSYRSETSPSADRDIAAALEAARSQAAFDMAKSAGERRHRQVPGSSNGS